MKKIFCFLLTFVLAASMSSSPLFAHGEEKHSGDTITVKGELLDTACYMAHPDTGRGEKHRKCASLCVKRGVPMSVITAEGELYLLLPDHQTEEIYEAAKNFAADQVEVTGTLKEMNGIRSIIVAEVKKITE